jgi:hypothetical protein
MVSSSAAFEKGRNLTNNWRATAITTVDPVSHRLTSAIADLPMTLLSVHFA